MFNDKYGLTNAVLRRTKNVTRRIAYDKELKHELHTGWDDSKHLILCDGWMQIAKSKYAVGEELAIAQSYRSLLGTECLSADKEDTVCKLIRGRHAGSTNKMFVKTSLMPNHIRITAITLERLQDISDADCARFSITFMTKRMKCADFARNSKQGKMVLLH